MRYAVTALSLECNESYVNSNKITWDTDSPVSPGVGEGTTPQRVVIKTRTFCEGMLDISVGISICEGKMTASTFDAFTSYECCSLTL